MSGRLEFHYSPDLTYLVNSFLKRNPHFRDSDGQTVYLTHDVWRIPTLKRQWKLQKSTSYALDYPFWSMLSFIHALYEKMNIPLRRALFRDQAYILHEIILHLREELHYFYSSERPPASAVIKDLTSFFNTIRLDEADRDILKSSTQRLALSTSDKLFQDLTLIFDKYLAVLDKKYLDEAGLLKEITQRLNPKFLKQYFPKLKTIVYEDISLLKKRHLDLFEKFWKSGIDIYFLMAYGKNKEIFTPKDSLFNKIRYMADHVEGYLDIRKLSDSLFQVHPSKFPFAEKIQIYPARSRLDEIESIAARIKDTVNSGQCSCAEIAVCSPQLEVYKPYLQIYFTRYGIPFTHDGKTPLNKTLPVKNILLLLETVSEDYPISRLEQVMTAHLLRYKEKISDPGILQLLPTLRVKQGRREIIRYLKKQQQLEDSQAPEKGKSTQYRELATLCKQIFDDLRALEKILSTSAWFDIIISFAESHQMSQKIVAEAEVSGVVSSQVNLAALDGLIEALQQWKKFSVMIRGTVNMCLQEFIVIFKFIMESVHVNIRMPQRTGVQILALDELMRDNFKQIFIMGMGEEAFPRKARSGFSPPQYLSPHLISFIEQDQFLRDREHFLQIIQNPATKIVFTYPRYHQDKPLLPSLFLRELERLSDSPLEKREALRLYSPAEVIEHFLTLQDAGNSEKINGGQIAESLRSFISDQSVKRLRLKMKVIGSRQSDGPFSIWEGDLSENALVSEFLMKRFEASHFSPTQLETFAYCPMIFFFERILNIRTDEEREVFLSPLDRGVLVHDILYRFYTELIPDKQNLPELLKIAQEELSKLSVTPNLLWELDKGHFVGNEDVKGILPAFLEYEKQIIPRYSTRPTHFELSFGRPLRTHESHDKLSTEIPFLYQHQNEKFFFSGKIDRVEIDPNGVLLIVDYKTGALPGLKEMWEGQRLQLPIYLLAVYTQLQQQYPDLKMGGGAFYALGHENEIEKRVVFMDNAYNFVDQNLSPNVRLPNEKYQQENSPATLDDFLKLVLNHAVSYIRLIRKGKFGHTPDSSRCKSRNGRICDFFPICRVNALKQAKLRIQSRDRIK